MRKALVLLVLSALLFGLSVVNAYAGSWVSIAVSSTDDQIFPDRYATWLWNPLSCGTASVRQWTGQWPWDYSNWPNKKCDRIYSAWWYYDSFVPPVRYNIDWYGETGNVYDPGYFSQRTYVYGSQ